MIAFADMLFYGFSGVLLLSALGVVLSKNPVHAVLFLVMSFFTGACLWLLLEAEFLALILVLVYVGAVMVLFLFVVMMMDLSPEDLRRPGKVTLALAAAAGILVAVELVALFFKGFFAGSQGSVPAVSHVMGTTGEMGKVLFTTQLFAVEVAAMVLLVALVAAVTLTVRKRTDAIYTDAGDASKVDPGERIELVDVTPDSPLDLIKRKDGEGGR